MVDYHISSKSQGKDALGQVDIVAKYNGRRFHGMGLATDIVEASALALIHVMNHVQRAEMVAEQKQKLQEEKENV